MRKLSYFLLPFALLLTAFAQQSAIQQAQQQFEEHNYRAAAESFRAVLSKEPDNDQALSGLVDSLEALGDWRSALPVLEHLVSVGPAGAQRLDQLGNWRSWAGNRTGALESLSRACAMNKANPRYCTAYAVILAWRAEDRPQAVAQLRSVLATSPNYVPAIVRLAEILGWNKATRAEASILFQDGLKLEPQNVDVLVSDAEMLSYEREQRATALELYTRALSIAPGNTRALTGKAQVLAWTGHSAEALELYNTVLQSHPDNAAALRGKAQILNWRGHYSDASQLLQQARSSSPDDQQVSAEMARAQLGLEHYGEAQRIVTALPAEPDFADLRGELSRAVGRWTESGVAFRRNGNNLNYDQLTVGSSSMIGERNRLVVRYTPTLYTGGHEFNSNSYNAELDSRVNDRMSMRSIFGANTYPAIQTEYVGGWGMRYRLGSSVELHTGFDRLAVDETLLSLRGLNTPSGFTGQVTSNLANIGASYHNARHGYDGSITYTDGVFLGSNLDANRRFALEGNFGKQVAGTPYLRVAYGFAYTQFDYDADAPAPLPRREGGYFSPTQYLLNYGGLTVSHKFGRRIEVDATGTAGAQNVENTTSSFGDAQFAGTFAGHLLWRVSERNEIRASYEYLNVFNAFHRHLPGISWRHYF